MSFGYWVCKSSWFTLDADALQIHELYIFVVAYTFLTVSFGAQRFVIFKVCLYLAPSALCCSTQPLLPCDMWELSSLTRVQTRIPCPGRWILNQWTTREVPAAAAAKSLQSCPTLCDPIDGSPLGSSVPGILQPRILEWVAISFSNAWKWKVKSESEVAQSCPTLSDPMDCSLPGSSDRGIFPGKSTGVGCHCRLWGKSLKVSYFDFVQFILPPPLPVLFWHI